MNDNTKTEVGENTQQPANTDTHLIITERTTQQRVYTVYIHDRITNSYVYNKLLTTLNNCTANDIVHMHINTPGGYCDTGFQIINAMDNCKGKIVTHLDPQGCSMGTYLFFAGDEYVVYENSYLMFHTISFGTLGKASEIEEHAKFNASRAETIAKKYLTPFLSNDEIKRMLRGEDFWFDSKEIAARLKKISDDRSKKRSSKSKNVALRFTRS